MVRRLLITGAGGRLGRSLREQLVGSVPALRLTDIAPLAPARPGEEVVYADLAEPQAAADLCRGVDAIVHLAGIAGERSWPELMAGNAQAVINLWEGARLAGVDRILFASSNHAVGYYERSEMIDERAAPRPDTRYGVTKVLGEAVAYLYSQKYAVRGFCMRIGSFLPEPVDARGLATWLSPGDFERLVRVGLTAEYRFEIVYGISRNRRAWWDNSNAYRLGYEPQDDAETYSSKIAHVVLEDPVAERYQGGRFASLERVERAEPLSAAEPIPVLPVP